MSLNNPKSLVTEERLHEFYSSILPYLGGMPEVLANKFSKGDMYSTDEKMIGQWVDGKPLYQKVLTDTLPTTSSDGTMATKETAHNIANVDTIFVAGGYFTAGGITRTIIYLTNKGFQSKCGINATNLQLLNGCKDNNNAPTVVIVQYTKTTDTAISIGSDTDYSTEEKIVGTWIDGKPLYQKTINTGMPSSEGVVHNISNLDKCVSMYGILLYTTDTYEPLPLIKTSSAYIRLQCTDTSVYVVQTGTFSNVEGSYVTIQYTKTTD